MPETTADIVVESRLTIPEAASVAVALTNEEAMLAFVSGIPAEEVPAYLARLIDASTNIRAMTKGLEQRLIMDGLTGKHFTVNGKAYGFFGALQKGWRDIPGMIGNLLAAGLSAADIAAATSELRVTDLRRSAAALSTQEKQAEALELIEDGRVAKGERGAPSFKAMDEYIVVAGGKK